LLQAVPHQLLLFPVHSGHNWHPSPLQGSGLRSQRSGRQWIDSICAYCLWRAGEPWRQLSDRNQRNDAERWDYLEAARLIRRAFYALEEPKGLHLAQPVLNAAPARSLSDLKLAELPRKTLVEALLRENPALTDKNRLMKLRREKLARMLAETRMEAHRARPERLRA